MLVIKTLDSTEALRHLYCSMYLWRILTTGTVVSSISPETIPIIPTEDLLKMASLCPSAISMIIFDILLIARNPMPYGIDLDIL